jgi:hypothetical protein
VTGSETIAGGLFVTGGDASFNNRMFVLGDSSLNGRLFVNRDVSMNGNVSIGSNLTVNGNLTVSAYTTSSINNTITTNVFNVAEDISLNGKLFMSSDASLNGRLFVKADASLNGNLSVGGNVTAVSFNATSDYRVKADVQVLDGTYVVDRLRPVSYTNTLSNKKDVGFLAHEVQEEFPFLVTGEKDAEVFQSLNYIGLIGVLVKEMKDMKAEMVTLKSQQSELKAKVDRLP